MRTLRIWCGPVASEKTTRALYAAKRLVRQGHDLVLVRPSVSKRKHEVGAPGFLVTKAGERWPCIEIESANQIGEAAQDATTLWIDEPFFLLDQDVLYKAVRRVLKHADVLMSTITSTSEMKPIGSGLSGLLAIADEIHQCRADCDGCGRLSSATRSWHKQGPKKKKLKVGGEESYEPLCPECWAKRSMGHPLEEIAKAAD